MTFCRMELNGLERAIDGYDATARQEGVFFLPVNYAGPVARLKTEALYRVLEAEHGILRSGVTCGEETGFLDEKVVGAEAVKVARHESKSHLWTVLDGRTAWIMVLPEIAKNLEGETPREYARRILDTLVTFVETPQNYRK